MNLSKIKKNLFALLFVVGTNAIIAQTQVVNVWVDGVPIYGSCPTLDFGTKSNVSITSYYSYFTMGRPTGYVNILTKFDSSSTPVVRGTRRIESTDWLVNSITGGINCNLDTSQVQISGSTIFTEFKPDVGTAYTFCELPIIKTPIPSFILNPTTLSLDCGINPILFNVTPTNIPVAAVVTYQWSYNGWTGINSTTNSISLSPSSATSLPSSVSVTPYINNVAQNTITCTVSRATFNSSSVINGNSSICNLTENYSISNLLSGSTIIWSSSNTSIATVSNITSTTVTVNKIGSGNFNLIATLTNSCGQVMTIVKPLTAFTISSLPVPSGRFNVGVVNCNNDGVKTINFVPSVPFGGVITLDPDYLPHPLRSQTQSITVTYINPCTGASTSRVISYVYRAPDCRFARLSNSSSTFNVYPSPAKDIVNIELFDKSDFSDNSNPIYGELFDINGVSISKIEILDNQATFSVADLKKGIYVLKIYIDDNIENHKVTVF